MNGEVDVNTGSHVRSNASPIKTKENGYFDPGHVVQVQGVFLSDVAHRDSGLGQRESMTSL
jgi:hypothetical protein